MKMIFCALLATMTLSSVFADDTHGKKAFLPKNNMRIYATDINANGMTEEKFLSIIKRVSDIYAPIVESKGAILEMINLWNDPSVDGYADRIGNKWQVATYGGLARHPSASVDGFMLIICHEIGHHLGGAPMFPDDWAANEGQADYFATLKCMRRILEADDNIAIVANMAVDAAATRQCEKVYGHANESALCQRVAMAGKSIAELITDINGYPYPVLDFDTPDPNVAGKTNNKHSMAQCRMDTFFNGALCDKHFTEDVSDTSPIPGTCIKKDGYKVGPRPLCWYKPGDDEI